MAYYPAEPGAWVFKTYGGYGDAWGEAKTQARRTLYRWAAAGEPRTYTELVQTVTAIPWPEGAYTHSGQQVGWLLGQVSIEELSPLDDRPLLSSLVINLEANASVGGFWTLAEELYGPIAAPLREEFWVKESKAAIAYYGPRSAS